MGQGNSQSSSFAIRAYHPSDLYRLYRICLETGADGNDATGTIDDEILGHFFAAPYAVLEPALCLVLTEHGLPCGYILGTADSNAFAHRTATEWFPALRERYPLPATEDRSRDAGMIRAIHAGYRAPDIARQYPAHLHIDILPTGQGRGFGKALMDRFMDALVARGCPGVHLGVSQRNERALAFYPKLGFEILTITGGTTYFGRRLA